MKHTKTSERFDVNGIRKVREYNSLRHIQITSQEIIAETKEGAEKVRKLLERKKGGTLGARER